MRVRGARKNAALPEVTANTLVPSAAESARLARQYRRIANYLPPLLRRRAAPATDAVNVPRSLEAHGTQDSFSIFCPQATHRLIVGNNSSRLALVFLCALIALIRAALT